MKYSLFISVLPAGIALLSPPVAEAHRAAHTHALSPRNIGSMRNVGMLGKLGNMRNMTVDSLYGPVTDNEIQSFIDYIEPLTPKPTNVKNEWAQGHSGENLKAMALVYEIAPRKEIMNKMVSFCDTLLSSRNDLNTELKLVIWTGRVDPVWPNRPHEYPIQTGGEQGDPVGHLATCAKQILQTKALHNQIIPDGDPHQFGTTYLERAERYVLEADKSVNQHILKSLLNVSNRKRMYFSNRSPYKARLAVPWNQQMMFDYGFMNLAQAHELLGDAPKRVEFYDQIIRANIKWFFENGVTRYPNKTNPHTYDWGYAMPQKTGEDANHGSLDVAGLYRLYQSGRYGIRARHLAPIANTVMDVMRLEHGQYAGRLNGSSGTGNSAGTNRLRSGFLFTALFRPDAYEQMVKDSVRTNSMPDYSRLLWLKHQRAQSSRQP